MLRKEIGYLKLSIVMIQILIILLGAPLTREFLEQLLNGAIMNTVTLFVLFALNAYGYGISAKNKFPKIGHMVGFLAIAIQSSLPLFIIATAILATESYLLLTDQFPFDLKNWIYQNTNKKSD